MSISSSSSCHFAVISLFPEMFAAISKCGVTRRAIESGKVSISFYNPRDFTEDTHRTVDDRPFGGGPGMVMMAEPLARAIEAAKAVLGDDAPVIALTPQGKVFTQAHAEASTQQSRWIFVCGRYEGIDERLIEQLVDDELSIGDYVLSGGELAAMVVMDAMIRLRPGVLGHHESAVQDSFTKNLLDHPHYTRPAVWRDMAAPEVLQSGDHAKIEQWRKAQSFERTQTRRPDLLLKDVTK